MPYVRELLPGGGRRGDGPGMFHVLKAFKGDLTTVTGQEYRRDGRLRTAFRI